MKKYYSIIGFLILLTCFINNNSFSQWQAEKSYFGPSIGLSFGNSVPEFGLNYEYGYTLKDIGVIGVGGLLRYWSYSDDWAWGKYTYTNILIGAQANYHFKLDDKKFDPYAGIMIGYDIVSNSWEDKNGWYDSYTKSSASGSELIADIQVGIRYFIKDNLAIVGRFGVGNASFSSLNIGVDWKF
jgi:hypothetical protein